MARHGDGFLALISGKPYFRTRIGKARPAIPIACTEEEQIKERVELLRTIAQRIRKADQTAVLESLLRQAAGARSPVELGGVMSVVADVCQKRLRKAPQLHELMTFGDLFELWMDGTLLKLFVGHLKPIKEKTIANYRSCYKKYVGSIIGKLPIRAITIEHGLEILQGVKGKRGGARRRVVANVFMRPMSIAVFPCRVLERSPFPANFRPLTDPRRAMAMLYPKEDATYLACVKIELVERLLEGLLAREGLRAKELTRAEVKDFDPVTRWFHLDKNKTNDPRGWILKEDSAEALRRYLTHIRGNPRPDDRLLVQGKGSIKPGGPLITHAGAERFRENAAKAGLLRAQLWENSETRRHLTVHDMRATFMTLSLAEGRTEAWITDRTGHRSSAMIYRYKRAARQFVEANLGSLVPLHEVIPELRELGAAATSAAAPVVPSAEDASEGHWVPAEGAAVELATVEVAPNQRADEEARGNAPLAQWTLTWTPAQRPVEVASVNFRVGTSAYVSPVTYWIMPLSSNREFGCLCGHLTAALAVFLRVSS